MTTTAGLIAGAIGLAVLDAVVSSTQGASNTAGVLSTAARYAKDFISATHPGLPPKSPSTKTNTKAASASAPGAVLA